MSTLYFIFTLIAVALIFDFFNGFHDAANSVATVVTTRVLSPVQAVFWAAFFNFVAAFLFSTGVAKTISDKLVDPHVVDVYVICGGLIGAIVWDIVTWLMALPTSSSHAIISGFAGAAIAKAGFSSLLLQGWIPVITFLIVSPVVGLILGWLLMTSISWLSYRSERYRAERLFRHLQLVSAGLYSLGHGTNDAQKTMGIIVALLVAAGRVQWSKPGSYSFGVAAFRRQTRNCMVDHPQLPRCHGAGHDGRRMAHRANRRLTYHSPPQASRRLFGGACRGYHDWNGNHGACAHLDDTRHRRCSFRSRRYPWLARGALDMGQAHRICVGADFSRGSPDWCRGVRTVSLGNPTLCALVRNEESAPRPSVPHLPKEGKLASTF